MVVIIDGKETSQTIRNELKLEVEKIKQDHNIIPGLGIILVGERTDSQTYVRMKIKACKEVGINNFDVLLPEDVLEEDSENEDSDQRTVTTNREEINETRKKAISSLEKKLKVKLVQNSRVLHWDETKKIRVAAIVSKRYERGHQPYWYAYHLKYQNYFKDAEKSYLLICCTDKNKAYAVPGDVINSKVEFLNSTPPDITKLNETDKYYWHLVLKEESNNLTLIIPKNNSSINLEEFACNF